MGTDVLMHSRLLLLDRELAPSSSSASEPSASEPHGVTLAKPTGFRGFTLHVPCLACLLSWTLSIVQSHHGNAVSPM